MRLKDKVAIVTGAARGIGRAIALHLAAEEARVAVVDVLVVEAEATASAIRTAGGDAVAVAVDVSDSSQVQAMVDREAAHWGGIDMPIDPWIPRRCSGPPTRRCFAGIGCIVRFGRATRTACQSPGVCWRGTCRLWGRRLRHQEHRMTDSAKVSPQSMAMALLETSSSSVCPIFHLPRRDWFYLLGPQTCSARNLVFGLAEFPAGTLAAAHDPTTPAARP